MDELKHGIAISICLEAPRRFYHRVRTEKDSGSSLFGKRFVGGEETP